MYEITVAPSLRPLVTLLKTLKNINTNVDTIKKKILDFHEFPHKHIK